MIQSSSRGFQEPFIRQTTIFLPNKVGEIGDVLRHFKNKEITVHALSVLDSVDFAVIRLVVDKTDLAMTVLKDCGIPVTENAMIGVLLPDDGDSLLNVCRAILSVEMNLHYMYSMITHMHQQSVLLLHVDDADLGVEVLEKRGFEIIGHDELLPPDEDGNDPAAW